jgi:hypothetical protein
MISFTGLQTQDTIQHYFEVMIKYPLRRVMSAQKGSEMLRGCDLTGVLYILTTNLPEHWVQL